MTCDSATDDQNERECSWSQWSVSRVLSYTLDDIIITVCARTTSLFRPSGVKVLWIFGLDSMHLNDNLFIRRLCFIVDTIKKCFPEIL